MPDLIIKPAATSGNKLILKDQAGGAVLTTADSGATLESGVTGGAGLTALGTVTTGTLGGSSVINTSGAITTTGLATVAKIVETGGVLKENLITNSGFDVWSNGTLQDVGSQLVTSWANHGSYPYVPLTVDTSDSDFIDFDALTNDGSLSYSWSGNILTPGKLYRVVISNFSGTGSGQFLITQSSGGTNNYTLNTALTDGTYVFEAAATDARLTIFGSAAASTNTFRMTCYEVTPGCVATDTKAMDGWFKDTVTDVIRQPPHATYTKDGSYYSLKVIFASGNEVMWPNGTTSTGLQGSPYHYERFQGRTMTFGVWCYSAAATLVRLQDSDGTSTATHTGGGGWEWLEVTRTCDSSITFFRVNLRGADAETVYFSQPMLVFGSSIGSGNYTRPKGETIYFETKQNSVSYYAAGFSDVSATVLSLESDSNGKIPKGAKAVFVSVESKDSGSASSEAYVRLMNSSTNGSMGVQSYPYGLTNDTYDKTPGVVPCDANGDATVTLNATGSGTLDAYIQYWGVQLH